jgi:2-polyprenyl-3-methyl-5-hydroxy-6-metoxy-1,4-benzoquinol methylase
MSPTKDGDRVAIPGEYQYRAITEGIAVQRFWHRAKLLAIARYLPPDATDYCLDVGCGSGVVSGYLGATARRVLGIDGNPDAIAFAQRQFGSANVAFRLGTVDRQWALDAPADKIYCLEVIEHIYPSQAREMLRTFHDALRRGGGVFLTTPNYRSLWPAIEWSMDRLHLTPRLADDQHVTRYHRRKLAAICRECGFRVETVSAMCFAAPWLAALNWRLAERVFALECAARCLPGSILVAVLRKP